MSNITRKSKLSDLTGNLLDLYGQVEDNTVAADKAAALASIARSIARNAALEIKYARAIGEQANVEMLNK